MRHHVNRKDHKQIRVSEAEREDSVGKRLDCFSVSICSTHCSATVLFDKGYEGTSVSTPAWGCNVWDMIMICMAVVKRATQEILMAL